MLAQDFNLHTHTYRCQYAEGKDEDYVIAALKQGYKTIGFSDHAPFPAGLPPIYRMDLSLFDDYKQSIKGLKEKYAGQIDVRLGIEAECYPECQETLDMFFNELEYVILSIHGRDASNPLIYAKHNSDEEIIEYGDIAQRVLGQRNWLYLAHPDYFLRKQTDFNEACIETTHKICQAAVKTNTIFECNLTGMYYDRVNFKQGSFYFYPHKMFWEIVSQYPIKCVFGLDAHSPRTFEHTEYYDIILEEFKDLHLNFIKNPLI